MIGDQVEDLISEGVQKIIIFTDSQAALNRIQHNEPGPGQTLALPIIRSTEKYAGTTSSLSFAGFLDMQASKAMKLRTNLPGMQQHRKMRKNYHLKRIGPHP
jgi:hypothetical protein